MPTVKYRSSDGNVRGWMPERPPILTAAAGEYYVAFHLSAMNFAVGLPRANTPGVDLLVANQLGTKTVAIQVKTRDWARRERKRKTESNHWNWEVGPRAGTLRGENIFYAFVDLRWGSGNPPQVFIVPSADIVSYFAGRTPKRWMWTLFDRDAPKYQEKWQLIEERLQE